MTLAEELAEKVYSEFYTVSPKYRTGERLCKLTSAAINEALERAAQECERQDHPDYVDGTWYATQIRKLKAGQ